MQTNCSEATVAALATSQNPPLHTDAEHRMYQGAVVVAILLFLVSLWSL